MATLNLHKDKTPILNYTPNLKRLYCMSFLLIGLGYSSLAQHSVARLWNDVLLASIREDFARPTIHARNLFHVSMAMYDAWAAYDPVAEPYMLGKNLNGFILPFEPINVPANVQAAREEAISYATYRIITFRFRTSPGALISVNFCVDLMRELGYDTAYYSTNYTSGSPAALGNYIAEGILKYGAQDGSNEVENYATQYYEPVNPPLAPVQPGNTHLQDPNRWQPLSLKVFIDQSGNPVVGGSLPFLGPEWGHVYPFAMTEDNRTIYEREGHQYPVYHDPGPPAYMVPGTGGGNSDEYQWGHTLVALWSSHLDPADSVIWDISPGSIGNNQALPHTLAGLRDFYNTLDGGDSGGKGHELNPHTGQPYTPQWVPRGDYTRVLAEFWADGPDSETPPGHWFSVLNYVSDHSEFEKRFKGEGPELNALEWDVKAYFTLGGAVHDAAVAAWGIKGYYDYIRPISAIRWMADQGQSTDPSLPNFAPDAIPLTPGLIEVVQPGDSLAGDNNEHLGKIKLFAWRGPDYIKDPETDYAGVGWILAENWWPYQRPSFVTPPFAGYISGHSTFSRAAAEVMTLLTGDPFFPGGMGEFIAKKNEFLVFEEGPSTDVILQWATYRDASDQTSLSRIWGGIHPPVDDIPGRLIGEKIGVQAFDLAEKYFKGEQLGINAIAYNKPIAYPNPVSNGEWLSLSVPKRAIEFHTQFFNLTGQLTFEAKGNANENFVFIQVKPEGLPPGLYLVRVKGGTWEETFKVMVQ